MSMYIREPVISSLKPVSELLVINPEQMHDGGVKIMHMHGVLRDVIAVVIRCSQRESLLNPRTRQKDGEATGVVIPSVIGRSQLALRVNRPAELPAPNDQGILK